LSNHDVERFATRWSGAEPNPALLKLGAAMQLSLRGSSCIYQGDELGLPEAKIAFEDLQDPYGITMWPEFKGRDGCRTPMPWHSARPDLGFSSESAGHVKPWLPVAESHRALAVDAQDTVQGSVLNFYRGLMRWRRSQTALIDGGMQLLPVNLQVLAFVRSNATQNVLCVFNFSAQSAAWSLPSNLVVDQLLVESGLTGAALSAGVIHLQPWSGAFLQLK
jgi:alpha-glucosidase